MAGLLGSLLTLVTFPGVVVHEFAHKKACDWIGVPVIEARYFRLGNPPGYVRHLEPERYRQSFAISVAPFLVNSVLAFALLAGYATLSATTAGIESGDTTVQAATWLTLWLGLSVGIHAFPSTGDARTLWDRSRAEWRGAPVVLLGVPVVALIYVANLLSRFYLDVLYAVGLLLSATALVGTI